MIAQKIHIDKKISFAEFDALYRTIVRTVYNFWTDEMQDLMAKHCYGWGREQHDFGHYLLASGIRYYTAYCDIPDGTQTICDIGGFWGVFPILLHELGYDVTMTESLQYYGDAFDPLFGYIARRGVTIIDYDPFDNNARLPNRYDFITIMAVLEHYPHSLKIFMRNVMSLLTEQGHIYIEVPNVAYLSKRVQFLFGRTPYTPIKEIYLSEFPFIGHHHEFTMAELRDLADLAGLRMEREHYYNYWRGRLGDPKYIVRHPLEWIAFTLLKDSRGVLSFLGERK